jgi:hypothetical protein
VVTGTLACPSWCDTYGQHDERIAQHSRRLLHVENDRINLSVYLGQTVERYSSFTPSGSHIGRTHIGSPMVSLIWEPVPLPAEFDMRMVELAPGVAALLGPVLEGMFGLNVLATVLAQAAVLVDAEDARTRTGNVRGGSRTRTDGQR